MKFRWKFKMKLVRVTNELGTVYQIWVKYKGLPWYLWIQDDYRSLAETRMYIVEKSRSPKTREELSETGWM